LHITNQNILHWIENQFHSIVLNNSNEIVDNKLIRGFFIYLKFINVMINCH